MELVKRFRVSRNEEEKVRLSWKLVRLVARYTREEPFWDFVREHLKLKPEVVKEAMLFLEEKGELEIKRSVDGRRLYVSTLKDIRKNPVRLDRWLGLTSGKRSTR
nr:hypothetical protein [Thermococcus sp.]